MYVKAGETHPSQDKFVKFVILQILPDKIVTQLPLQLKSAQVAEAMRSIIDVYLHDHKTGLARGQRGPMLRLAGEEEETKTYATVAAAATSHKDKDKEDTEEGDNGGDLGALKGNKKGKGKGKGYGQCWHCGQFGHPRRECLDYIQFQGGSVAALKGADWSGNKGKGKNDKGMKRVWKRKMVGELWKISREISR